MKSSGGLKYRPDIDGLRAVAVISVVLHHLSADFLPGGYVGVDVFFVISGYLITTIMLRELSFGSFSFRRFYERRARRLFPALFAMLAATLIVGWFFLLPSDYLATARATLGTVLFSSNILFWKSMAAGYFAADAKFNPLLHTWSLGVEEQFYLAFPIFLVLVYRYVRRWLPILLALGAAASLAAASLLVESHEVAVFFLSPFRAWELLAGALLAANAVPAITSRAVREIIAAAGLAAIVLACTVYTVDTKFPGASALFPVIGAAALIHSGTSSSTFAHKLLAWRPVVYIGLISYSLYLWHWPLIVLTRFATSMEPFGNSALLLLAVSLMLGSASYHWIEKPFRHGRGVSKRAVFACSSGAAVLLAGIALGVNYSNGFPGRYSPEVVLLDKARNPEISFRQCDGSHDTCVIGDRSKQPTVLLWGDSHMLAWAPALDRIFQERGEAALLAVHSACAPLLGAYEDQKPSCAAFNDRQRRRLEESQALRTVVVAAYWSAYKGIAGGTDAAASGAGTPNGDLKASIDWLASLRRDTYLIGPLPVFREPVPLLAALAAANGHVQPSISLAEHQALHAKFATIANGNLGSYVTYVDPAPWLCGARCGGEGVGRHYRDAHHLSEDGALYLTPRLRNALQPKSKVRASGPQQSIENSAL